MFKNFPELNDKNLPLKESISMKEKRSMQPFVIWWLGRSLRKGNLIISSVGSPALSWKGFHMARVWSRKKGNKRSILKKKKSILWHIINKFQNAGNNDKLLAASRETNRTHLSKQNQDNKWLLNRFGEGWRHQGDAGKFRTMTSTWKHSESFN